MIDCILLDLEDSIIEFSAAVCYLLTNLTLLLVSRSEKSPIGLLSTCYVIGRRFSDGVSLAGR